MRAFVRIRQMLSAHKDLERRFDALEERYDEQFKVVFDAIRALMERPEKSRKPIGFEVKEEKVDGSLEKALASYQKYLDETPESELTPEALRRVADLKIQKDYIAKDLHEESPVVADKNNVGTVRLMSVE